MSDSPGNIDDSFFIVSANKTKKREGYDHHGDDDDNKEERYLFMFNSSTTLAEFSDVPSFSNFTAIVYIVSKTHNIFKSEGFLVQTGEGGKW